MTPRNEYGQISGVSWSKIAAKLQNGRNAQTCCGRWKNAVDPKICKGTWGDAEYGILVKAHAAYIREWNMLTLIATALSGRFTHKQISDCLKSTMGGAQFAAKHAPATKKVSRIPEA
ncbi:hypothetical protein M885DRAFT_561979 [Pelagophyceae sp. CCMP2097]|nr:hypothetical protein M885DRAFT_561979 [Pelagophyceae sp. CCMP2097]